MVCQPLRQRQEGPPACSIVHPDVPRSNYSAEQSKKGNEEGHGSSSPRVSFCACGGRSKMICSETCFSSPVRPFPPPSFPSRGIYDRPGIDDPFRERHKMTSESVWLEDAFRSAARLPAEVQLADEGGSPRHSCFLDPSIASTGRHSPQSFHDSKQEAQELIPAFSGSKDAFKRVGKEPDRTPEPRSDAQKIPLRHM